jgi:hypothetical protein
MTGKRRCGLICVRQRKCAGTTAPVEVWPVNLPIGSEVAMELAIITLGVALRPSRSSQVKDEDAVPGTNADWAHYREGSPLEPVRYHP